MFEDLPLHDATLTDVHLDWLAGTCALLLSRTSGQYELRFNGVSDLAIPRRQPWGPSVSINSLRKDSSGLFEIEMQSGDILRISASSWSFSDLKHGEDETRRAPK
jgi:hypothetical protein